MTIQGGSPGATLDGNATGSVLTIVSLSAPTLTVRNLTITNGLSHDGGGISDFFCFATVNLVNALVTENTATDTGGGIAGCGIFNVTNSTISDNTAGGVGSGGGIYEAAQSLTVTNSSVTGNHAASTSPVFGGGGIYANSTSLVLTGATVSRNTTTTSGGGIDMTGNTLSATGSTISGNTAADDGGGIEAVSTFATLTATHVSANTAGGNGGGIDFGDAFELIIGSPVRSGGAASPSLARGPRPSGGPPAVPAAAAQPQVPTVVFQGLDLESSTVDHNTAQSGAGGGIDNFACNFDSAVLINNSTVAFNRATGSDLDTDSGGGGYSQYGNECGFDTTASLVATNSSFGGNLAKSSVGGGIFNVNLEPGGAALVTLEQSSVQRLPMSLNDNQAAYGGGMFNWGDGANTTLQAGAHVIHNQASVNGGGVFDDCAATLTVAPGALIMFNMQVVTNLGPCVVND